MQIALGDKLHKLSNPICKENEKNIYRQFVVSWLCP